MPNLMNARKVFILHASFELNISKINGFVMGVKL